MSTTIELIAQKCSTIAENRKKMYEKGIESDTTNEWMYHICMRDFTEVEIPDGVTEIGFNAFYNCKSLTSVTIPNSVTSISGAAFQYCSSLSRITIPNSVTYIAFGAFLFCSNLTDVYYGGTQEQWNAMSIGGNNDPLTSATIHYNS